MIVDIILIIVGTVAIVLIGLPAFMALTEVALSKLPLTRPLDLYDRYFDWWAKWVRENSK